MKLTHPDRSRGDGIQIRALVAVAVIALLLFGALFHHHTSEADAFACSFCQAGLETPVPDLAGVLATTSFVVVWCVTQTRPCCPPRVVHFATLVPRAPPLTTLPVIFWEGRIGPV